MRGCVRAYVCTSSFRISAPLQNFSLDFTHLTAKYIAIGITVPITRFECFLVEHALFDCRVYCKSKAMVVVQLSSYVFGKLLVCIVSYQNLVIL